MDRHDVVRRSGHTERGRDGCRVPLPWARDEPGFGFSPTGATWLPQPASWGAYALDAQVGVTGSTYELYRTALRLRRELGLGEGSLAWVESPGAPDARVVLAFENEGVLVLANLGAEPVRLPDGAQLLAASGPLDASADAVLVPSDTTVWARLAS